MLKQLITLSTLFLFSACAGGNLQTPEVTKLLEETEKNMVFVKGGSYIMGDPLFIDNERGEYGDERQIIGSPENKKKYPDAPWEPTTFGSSGVGQHKVTLDDFYMQKYMVTWAEFDAYSEATGKEIYKKRFIGKRTWRKPNHSIKIQWQPAKDYCQWLGKQTGKNYDLATEAQWEYAARSRGKYVFWATNDGSGRKFGISPNIADGESPVGTMPPNPLGLYDMSSEFRREWVNDWYTEDYYENSPELNPKGPKTGTLKVLRNSDDDGGAIVYRRWHRKPQGKYKIAGFRCIINP